MTYNVFGGTLNPYSTLQSDVEFGAKISPLIFVTKYELSMLFRCDRDRPETERQTTILNLRRT